MRSRIAAAFILLTVLLIVGLAFARDYAAQGDYRSTQSVQAARDAGLLAQVIAQRDADGQAIDADFLLPWSKGAVQITYDDGSGEVLRVGDDLDLNQMVSATAAVEGAGNLTVAQASRDPVGFLGHSWSTRLFLLFVLAILAGALGWLFARAMSAPFRQLAAAAAALGRGRFDLDLPRSRLPEVQSISRAIEQSASQLRDRLTRERHFATHASHVIRTPLTSVRLQLEDIASDPAVPAELRAGAQRSVQSIDSLKVSVDELLELTRRGALMGGAEVPLRELATSASQWWADQLDEEERSLTAAVEGDLDALVTPGPLEHLLDLLLRDITEVWTGSVRLVLAADAASVRVSVLDTSGARDVESALSEEATDVLEAVGGRVLDARDPRAIQLLLPRR